MLGYNFRRESSSGVVRVLLYTCALCVSQQQFAKCAELRTRRTRMLTTTAEGCAEMITLIIQNSYCQQGSTRIPVTMATDENVQALLVKVAEECHLVVGTFALCSNSFTLKLDDPGADATKLLEIGCTQKQRLRVEGINGRIPEAAASTAGSGSSVAAQALGTVALWSAGRADGQQHVYGPLASGIASSAEVNADGFIGLINQVSRFFPPPPVPLELY